MLNNFGDAIAGLMVGRRGSQKTLTHEKSIVAARILVNVDDNQGRDLNTFCADLVALLTKGRPHILIDHPKKPEEAQTAADDAARVEPILVLMELGVGISAYANDESGRREVLENSAGGEALSLMRTAGGLTPTEKIREMAGIARRREVRPERQKNSDRSGLKTRAASAAARQLS